MAFLLIAFKKWDPIGPLDKGGIITVFVNNASSMPKTVEKKLFEFRVLFCRMPVRLMITLEKPLPGQERFFPLNR